MAEYAFSKFVAWSQIYLIPPLCADGLAPSKPPTRNRPAPDLHLPRRYYVTHSSKNNPSNQTDYLKIMDSVIENVFNPNSVDNPLDDGLEKKRILGTNKLKLKIDSKNNMLKLPKYLDLSDYEYCKFFFLKTFLNKTKIIKKCFLTKADYVSDDGFLTKKIISISINVFLQINIFRCK